MRSAFRKELADLVKRYKSPARIYEWVLNNRDSETHKFLKRRGAFDPKKAMREYGIGIIQDQMVRVRVLMESEDGSMRSVRAFVSLPSDRGSGYGYRVLGDVLADAALRQEMLDNFYADAEVFAERYRVLETVAEAAPVLRAIKQATAKRKAKPKRKVPVLAKAARARQQEAAQ